MSVEQSGQRSPTPTLPKRQQTLLEAAGSDDRSTNESNPNHGATVLRTLSPSSRQEVSKSRRHLRMIAGYALAALLQLAAGALTLRLSILLPAFAIGGILSLLIVVVVALIFGTGPSLVATAIGALMLDVVVLSSQLTSTLSTGSRYLEVLLFLAVGCSISVFPSRVTRARREAE